jgi:hypothetical protein
MDKIFEGVNNMESLIEEFGFLGYIQRFPVNPITLVAGAIIIGIIVLFINAAIKKNKANQFLVENIGAVIMTFHKKKIGNNNYADNIRIIKINNESAHWFFLRPAIPAVYLKPGENRIEVYAEWARGGGSSIKMFKTDVVEMVVTVKTERHYSLEYYIPENKYIFEPFENERLFGK